MKYFAPLPLFLAACSQQASAPSIETGVYAGEGRNRVCIADEGQGLRGGVIIFGPGDVNCSASGGIDDENGKLSLVPRGEGPCRIPLTRNGDTIRIGQVPQACSYYCGPGASFSDKSFVRSDDTIKALDLAGDPLC